MADELIISAPADKVYRSTGILWGPPKVGKTTLLMSLPGKKLVINLDPDGTTSVAGREDMKMIDLSIYENTEIVGFMKAKVIQMIAESEEFGEGDSVIFDSASSYNQAALQTAVKNGVGKSTQFTPTMEVPGLSAYGARTQYTIDAFSKLLKVTGRKKMHCWFTAHEDTPTTNKTGDFLFQSILMSDNAINQVGLQISEMWYMFDNDKKRTIAVRACRGHKPMGSRIFRMDSDPEFILKYDPDKPNTQLHSIETWWNAWLAGGKHKLELPA